MLRIWLVTCILKALVTTASVRSKVGGGGGSGDVDSLLSVAPIACGFFAGLVFCSVCLVPFLVQQPSCG